MANTAGSEGFNPPPAPSTPDAAPWDQMKVLIASLQELSTILKSQAAGQQIITVPSGGPASAGITTVVNLPAAFGPAGSTQQLISVMLENTSGALGEGALLPFGKTIATEYQDEEERLVTQHSILTHVLMSFPAGCQQLVDVRLIYYGKNDTSKYIIPSVEETYVALDDTTVIFQPNTQLVAPGKLRVEWYNYDTLNTHKVPVLATLKPTSLVG